MLNLTAATIYLCLDPTDMRKSFDTLAVLVREHLQGDPQSGSWFVFRNKAVSVRPRTGGECLADEFWLRYSAVGIGSKLTS